MNPAGTQELLPPSHPPDTDRSSHMAVYGKATISTKCLALLLGQRTVVG